MARKPGQANDILRECVLAGMPEPTKQGDNYLSWESHVGTLVIIRGFAGRAGLTLDARWIEPDGKPNGLFAPKDYDYIPFLARDTVLMFRSLVPGRTVRDIGCRA